MRELCKINSTWGIDVIGRLLKKKTFLEIKMPVRECLKVCWMMRAVKEYM